MYGYTRQPAPPAYRVPRNAYGYANAGRNAGAYPSRSNGWSGAAGSLWWQANYDGAEHICATQAGTIIRSCQTRLRAEVPMVFTIDGVLYSSADVTTDGNFGPGSLAALRRVMQNYDPPQAIVDAMRNDWQRLTGGSGNTLPGSRGLPISLATMAAIIYLGAHANLAWSALSIPTTMGTIHFAEPAPVEGSAAGQIRCAPFSQGAAGLDGPDAQVIPVGGSTPRGTPTVPGTAVGPAAVPDEGGGGEMVLGLLLVIGLAMAAGKKRL
jgi:hypothetical protein